MTILHFNYELKYCLNLCPDQCTHIKRRKIIWAFFFYKISRQNSFCVFQSAPNCKSFCVVRQRVEEVSEYISCCWSCYERRPQRTCVKPSSVAIVAIKYKGLSVRQVANVLQRGKKNKIPIFFFCGSRTSTNL